MPKLFHTLCCCIRPNSYKKSEGECENAAGGGAPPSSIITQVNKGQQPGTIPGQLLPNAKQRHNAAMAAAGNNQVQQQQGVGGGRSMYSSPSPLPSSNDHLVDYNSPLSKNKAYLRKDFLLPRPHTTDHMKKCLIVDLDETLVHSSFKPVKNADFIIPVEIDNVVHQVYVLKRPYTDEFLERVGTLFECVLFTASLAKYADPVADLLDKRSIFRSRLFREACVFFEGNYVKDLDRLGRELHRVVIIDNSPASYAFHPDNAIPVRTWFDDPHDCELLELIPLLEELAHPDKDIYSVLGTCPPAVRQKSPNALQNNNNESRYLNRPAAPPPQSSSSLPAGSTTSSTMIITSASNTQTTTNATIATTGGRRNQQEKGSW